MSRIKEGDHVRVTQRAASPEDRKSGRYYDHMAGLSGIVQNVYSQEEIAVRIEPSALSSIARDVHKEATRRMREKFLAAIGEEQKSKLTPEELEFPANYMLLVRGEDLEKI